MQVYMDFDRLTEVDKTIVGQALRAAADGPFFPDWEFHTLFGMERGKVRAIADAWPKPAASSEEMTRAVHSSLGNLVGYPHRKDAEWPHWISVSHQQLNELFNHLRLNTDSLSRSAQTELLARIAHELTICARDTYEVGTENVLEPRVLRAYNELLHRVTGAVGSHIPGADVYPLEAILEMIRSFGGRYNRAKEIEAALNRAMRQSE